MSKKIFLAVVCSILILTGLVGIAGSQEITETPPPTVTETSRFWKCVSVDQEPLGDIELLYVNQNSANKANIFAITPQIHPIIIPGVELFLQLHSPSCFKFDVAIKDSGGNDIKHYSGQPYSPHSCDIETSGYSEEFLTNIELYAPENPGRYTIEVYDPDKTLLTTGSIEVLKPSDEIGVIETESICEIDNLNYSEIMEVPYPLIAENGAPGKIKIKIAGGDEAKVREIMKQVSMSVSPMIYVDISLNKSGALECSNNICVQDYSLSSSSTTHGIIYAWQEIPDKSGSSSVAINSNGITILDLDSLKSIKYKLENLSSVASEYVRYYEYYSSGADKEKIGTWKAIHDKIVSMINEIKKSEPALNSRKLKIMDIDSLVKFLNNSQKGIDEIVNSLTAVGYD